MPTVRCPGCGRSVPVALHEPGATVKCARCGIRFPVRATGTSVSQSKAEETRTGESPTQPRPTADDGDPAGEGSATGSPAARQARRFFIAAVAAAGGVVLVGAILVAALATGGGPQFVPDSGGTKTGTGKVLTPAGWKPTRAAGANPWADVCLGTVCFSGLAAVSVALVALGRGAAASCPSCHKWWARRLGGRSVAGPEQGSGPVTRPSESAPAGRGRTSRPGAETTTPQARGPVVGTKVLFQYQCRHCGFRWVLSRVQEQ
jgi:hypothetical protein